MARWTGCRFFHVWLWTALLLPLHSWWTLYVMHSKGFHFGTSHLDLDCFLHVTSLLFFKFYFVLFFILELTLVEVHFAPLILSCFTDCFWYIIYCVPSWNQTAAFKIVVFWRPSQRETFNSLLTNDRKYVRTCLSTKLISLICYFVYVIIDGGQKSSN